MDANTNLKYEKQIARDVLSGNKRYEIRKASKGYTSGRKNLVSIGGTLNGASDGGWQPKKIYGSAFYWYLGKNLKLHNRTETEPWFIETNNGYLVLDEITYNFAKKNYIDKGIDYVVFEIDHVDATASISEEE